jgi:hypothetical protein
MVSGKIYPQYLPGEQIFPNNVGSSKRGVLCAPAVDQEIVIFQEDKNWSKNSEFPEGLAH